MFGRRKVPIGGTQDENQNPPPVEPFPIDKMDDALESAIRLFTKVLDGAGVDAGGLAIRGDPGADVSGGLARCITYRSKPGELTYLALGITPDFKSFAYPPHCRLYFILNSTGICEDPHAAAMLNSLAPAQLPEPMVDAHFLRRWIRFILPTGRAMSGGPAAVDPVFKSLVEELMQVVRLVPPSFFERLKLEKLFKEWASGLPGTIGHRLDDNVQRMNGLPVTPFIGNVLTDALARLQMDGLRHRG